MAYKRISPQPVIEGGTGAQTFTLDGVLIGNTTGAITTTAAGTTGQVLTGVTGSPPTFQAPAASSITITGDTGGGLTGNSFTFTGGTTGLVFNGAGSTETLGGVLIVPNGGTGISTTTAYAPICGGTTATGNFQAAATGLSTAGYVLTSNGSSALPSFQSNPSTAGLIFLGTQTISGGTAIQFLTQITSTYDNYLVLLSAVTTNASTLSNQLIMEISTNGGSSWIATGYNYTLPNGGTGASINYFVLGASSGTTASTVNWNSSIELNNMTAATNYPSCWAQTHFNSTVKGYETYETTTIYTSNATVNAIQIITTGTGTNIFSGTAYLYGYVE